MLDLYRNLGIQGGKNIRGRIMFLCHAALRRHDRKKQTDRQINRQTDEQTNKQTKVVPSLLILKN